MGLATMVSGGKGCLYAVYFANKNDRAEISVVMIKSLNLGSSTYHIPINKDIRSVHF
jgi:diphthamide synthase (EF-2-diphthine--ammonia ligase)